jgi:hypothetical protein
MSYFSIKATSDHEDAFPKYTVLVGKGLNVFTLVTEDIEATLKEFTDAGVKILEVHPLSGRAAFHGLPSPGVLTGNEPSEQEDELRQLGEGLPEAR